MPYLNTVSIMGNVTADPELRHTPSGTPVCELGLALNRRYKTDDGQQKEETTFVSVTLWSRTAEVAAKYCKKGEPLFIQGRLFLDTWKDRESGKDRSRLKIVGEQVQLLGRRPQAESTSPAQRPTQPQRQPAAPAAQRQAPMDPDLDADPDDTPFRSTIYRDVRQSRLNRRIF